MSIIKQDTQVRRCGGWARTVGYGISIVLCLVPDMAGRSSDRNEDDELKADENDLLMASAASDPTGRQRKKNLYILDRGKSETIHSRGHTPKGIHSLPDLSRLKSTYSAIKGISWYNHTTDADTVINILSSHPEIDVLYMTPNIPQNHPDYSPYIMHLVEPGACDVGNYCAVARSGVTRYIKGKKPKHLSLARWRFEQATMLKLREKPFFKQFKMRKAFHELAVGTQDMSNFGVFLRRLRSRLFTCSPAFTDTLLQVRRFCLDMAGVSIAGFSGLSDPELTYTLAEFVEEKKHFASDLFANLKRIHILLTRVTSRHCWDDVISADLAMDKAGAKSKTNAGELRKRQRESVSKYDLNMGAWCSWEEPGKQREMEVVTTERCYRLSRFIYLIDCLQQNALHTVVTRYLAHTRQHLLLHVSLLPSDADIKNLVRGYTTDLNLSSFDVSDDSSSGGGGGKGGGKGDGNLVASDNGAAANTDGSSGGKYKSRGCNEDIGSGNVGQSSDGGNVGGSSKGGNVSGTYTLFFGGSSGILLDGSSRNGSTSEAQQSETSNSEESLMQRIEVMLRSNDGGEDGVLMMGQFVNEDNDQQRLSDDLSSDSITFSLTTPTPSSEHSANGGDLVTDNTVAGYQSIDAALMGPSFPVDAEEDNNTAVLSSPDNVALSNTTITSDDTLETVGNETDVNTSSPNNPNLSPNEKGKKSENSHGTNIIETGYAPTENKGNAGAKSINLNSPSVQMNVANSNNSKDVPLRRDSSETTESDSDMVTMTSDSRLSEVFETLMQDVVEPCYPVTTSVSALKGLEFPILDADMWELEDVETCLRITMSTHGERRSSGVVVCLQDVSVDTSNVAVDDNSSTDCVIIKPRLDDGHRRAIQTTPTNNNTFPVNPEELRECLNEAQDEGSPLRISSGTIGQISFSDYTIDYDESSTDYRAASPHRVHSVIGGNIFGRSETCDTRQGTSDLVLRHMPSKGKTTTRVHVDENVKSIISIHSQEMPYRQITTPRIPHLSTATDVETNKAKANASYDKNIAMWIPTEESRRPAQRVETAGMQGLHALDDMTTGELLKLLMIRRPNQNGVMLTPGESPVTPLHSYGTGLMSVETEGSQETGSSIGCSRKDSALVCNATTMSRGESNEEFHSAAETLNNGGCGISCNGGGVNGGINGGVKCDVNGGVNGSPNGGGNDGGNGGLNGNGSGGGGNDGGGTSGGSGGGGSGSGGGSGGGNGCRDKPMFHLSLLLKNNEAVFVPDLSQFTDAAFSLIHAVEEHVAVLPNLTDSPVFQPFLEKATPRDDPDPSLHGIGNTPKGPKLTRTLLTDISIAQAKTSIYSAHEKVVHLANVYRHEMGHIFKNYFRFTNAAVENTDIDTFYRRLQLHDAQLKIIGRLPESQILGMYFLVDVTPFRDQLNTISQDMLSQVGRDISDEVSKRIRLLVTRLDELEDMMVSRRPETDSLFRILVAVDDIDTILAALHSDHISHIAALYDVIDRFEVPHHDHERSAFTRSYGRMEDIRRAAKCAEKNRSELVAMLENYATKDATAIGDEVNGVLAPLVKRPWLLDGEADVTTLMQALTETEGVVRSYVKRANFLRRVERYLKKSTSEFGDLFNLASRHVNTRNLWLLMADWDSKIEGWKHQDFNSLNIVEINQYTFKYIQAVDKLDKVLPRGSVVVVFREKMDQMLRWLSFIIEFRGNSVKPRHWRQIETVLGVEFGGDFPHNLGNLMAANAIDKQKALRSITTRAKAESNVQYEFDEAKQRVDALVVPIRQRVKPLVDGEQPITIFSLGETFEVEESLNFFTMEMERIDSSPHAAFLHDELQEVVLAVFEMMENLVNVGEMAERTERLRRMVMRHPELQEAAPDLLRQYREVYMGVSSFLQTLGRGSGLTQWSNSQPLRDFVSHYHRMINDVYRAIKRFIDSRAEPGTANNDMLVWM